MLRKSIVVPSDETDLSCCQLVANEQLIGDRLHLASIEHHMSAPPLLEFKITRRFAIDLGIEVVGLGPIGVGRVEIFEVANQPCAVELAVSEITHQSGQPAAAEQPAGVAHGVLSTDPGPVG